MEYWLDSNAEMRAAIWRTQITKYTRDAGKFDVGTLARASEGLTGAEVEQAFIDALYQAFAEGQEPTTLTCSLVLGELVPLSRLMGEQLKALREWARGRARLATSRSVESTERRIAA
jgi:SpoVK/Ycf46/Vps4 family AAA+-type ATPase